MSTMQACQCSGLSHFFIFVWLQKVFSEAEEMAQRYRDQISEKHQPAELDSSFDEVAPFDDEAVYYANWKWLRFSKSDKTNFNPRAESGL